MKNAYLQLTCKIWLKNQNPSYKGHLNSGHFVNLPQVTTIDRLDNRRLNFIAYASCSVEIKINISPQV